jgi:nucleotide-binding universal stress UspA family protein
MLAGTVIAAALTTVATIIIFGERMFETPVGAWIYFPLILGLYLFFSYFRRALGAPSALREELGRREEAMFGIGIPPRASDAGEAPLPAPEPALQPVSLEALEPATAMAGSWKGESAVIKRIVVSLDGSDFGERALPMARAICQVTGAAMTLVSVIPVKGLLRILPSSRGAGGDVEAGQVEREGYLAELAGRMRAAGIKTDYFVAAGPVAEAIEAVVEDTDADILVMSTRGRSGMSRFLMGSVANAVVQLITRPVLLLRPAELSTEVPPQINKVLVTLDGSSFSERVLPYAKTLAQAIDGEILLLTVPEVPEPEMYGPMYDAVEELRHKAEANAERYLHGVANGLREEGANVRAIITGSRPATTIVEVAEQEHADLIMLATHGRGGMQRLMVGSVADRVVHHAGCPVFLVPVNERHPDMQ